MSLTRAFLVTAALAMVLAAPAQATTGDLSTVIDSFVAKQYPQAHSHFWVVNSAQWQDENELVVDLNAFAFDRIRSTPTERRFLLLIVEGRLAASQSIPLDANVDCQPETT